MTLPYDYTVEVLTSTGPDVWTPVACNNISTDEYLSYSRPMTARFELGNNRGTARTLFPMGRQVRVKRNGALLYLGVVVKPSSKVNPRKRELSPETRDYYRDRLMGKQTGPAYIWNFKSVSPMDILRSLIGTLFIVQEYFESDSRISNYDNTCLVDRCIQLVKNGATYQSTGTLTSKGLTNACTINDDLSADGYPDQMGDIQSLTAHIEGTPATGQPVNLITTNQGYESDLSSGWTVQRQDYDVTDTDTLTADFSTGTLSDVIAQADALILALTGTNVSLLDTLTADFDAGTKVNVSSAGDKIALAPDSTWLSGYTYRKSRTITGTSDGAQTNYTMRFTVYSGSGTSTGSVVYLGGRTIQADWDDIRWTASDGTTLLDFKLVSNDGTTSAVFDVEVPSIPASPGTTTVYIYYSNAGATSASSGAAYALYNDGDLTGMTTFNGSTTASGGNISIAIGSGVTTSWHNGGFTASGAKTNATLGLTDKFEFVVKLTVGNVNRYEMTGLAVFNNSNTSSAVQVVYYNNFGGSPGFVCLPLAGSNQTLNTTSKANTTLYLRLRRDGTYMAAWSADGITWTNITSSAVTYTIAANMRFAVYASTGNNSTAQASTHTFDWFYQRKYTTNEPTVTGAWGNEATQPVQATGSWTGPIDSISAAGYAATSSITWHGNVPAGTTMTVKASLNGGAFTTIANSGDPIPGMTSGYDCTGKTVQLKVEFTGDGISSAQLDDITVAITSGYEPYGYREAPGLSLTNVGICSGSTVSWNATTPPGTSVTVLASTDGITWLPCTSGQPLPGVTDGTNLAGKTLSLVAELRTTDPAQTPSLNDISVSITSRDTETVARDNTQSYAGSYSVHITRTRVNSWAGLQSIMYAALASKKYTVNIYAKGTCTGMHLHLYAYNSGDSLIGTATLDMGSVNDPAWTLHSMEYTTPVGTAKIDLRVECNGTGDIRVDDPWVCLTNIDVQLEASRDNGTNYYAVPLTFDGTAWTGTYTFTGAEPIKNQLKYRLTLNANISGTVSPVIENIRLDCVTASDTGVTEGQLDTYNDPLEEDDNIDICLGDMKRDKGIIQVIKITAQDAYTDTNGALHALNHRGSTIARVFTTGDDIIALDRVPDRDSIINVLTLIGSGQMNSSIPMEARYNVKDDASIAAHGRREDTLYEKNINSLSVLAKRANVLLNIYKDPAETIPAEVKDPRVLNYALGDQAHVVDPTDVTGVDQDLRITRISRKMSLTGGEKVSLDFSNTNMDLAGQVEALLDHVNNFMATDQSRSTPKPFTYAGECTNNYPIKLFVYIDPRFTVQDVLIWIDSEAFRMPVSAASTETSHTHGISPHDHEIQIPAHGHQYDLTYNAPTDYIVAGGTNHRHMLVDAVVTRLYASLDDAYATTSDSGGGQTSSGGSSHTHTLIPGIYPYQYGGNDTFAAARLYLNDPSFSIACGAFGIRGSPTERIEVNSMSLKVNYDPAASGVNKLGPGTNYIWIKPSTHTPENPNGLLRVSVHVQVLYQM